MKKFIAIPAIIGLLFASGCELPEEPESYSDQGKTTQEAGAPAPVTKPKKEARPQWMGKMNQIHIGMSQTAVKAILGKPDDTDSTEMEGFGDEGPTVMDSWTYGDMFSSKDGDDLWMLSFTNGELDSKTRM
jgi:hypothetical protein